MTDRVAANAQIVAAGLRFPEGPSLAGDASLYVVELAGRRVSRLRPTPSSASGASGASGDPEDAREIVADLAGSPNGSAFGPDGDLYVCNNGGRWAAEASTEHHAGPGDAQGLIQRIRPDGTVDDVLAAIGGVPLDAPNDLCFDRDGGLWFTDPVWPAGDGAMPPGSVCWIDPAGLAGDAAGDTSHAVRAHTGLLFPNGLAVTADGSTLVVAESGTCKLRAFPILGPGRLGEPAEYADLGAGAIPDGMCFDSAGRLLVAAHSAGGLFVVPPGGGAPQTVVELADPDPTNCCFGGPGHRTVYVTQADSGTVAAFRWDQPGLVLFPDRPSDRPSGDRPR